MKTAAFILSTAVVNIAVLVALIVVLVALALPSSAHAAEATWDKGPNGELCFTGFIDTDGNGKTDSAALTWDGEGGYYTNEWQGLTACHSISFWSPVGWKTWSAHVEGIGLRTIYQQ